MDLSRRTSLVAALFLLPAPFVHAQAAVDPSGHWEGAIQIPGREEFHFEVDLVRRDAGALAGAISSADAKGLQLVKVAVEGRSITFQARSDQPFSAVLSHDGKQMSGNATLIGYSLPFGMSRTGDARLEPPVTSSAVGKDVEGTWTGTMDANGMPLRLTLTVTNQSGGGAIARIVSLDEGGLTVPAVVTQNGSSVTYEQSGIAGSYSGTLNGDRTELVGTWTQGSVSLPLTFRRPVK
jgi:hypothetical protein